MGAMMRDQSVYMCTGNAALAAGTLVASVVILVCSTFLWASADNPRRNVGVAHGIVTLIVGWFGKRVAVCRRILYAVKKRKWFVSRPRECPSGLRGWP